MPCRSLQEIAREKAGIFKAGRPAITVPQPADAAAALEERAAVAGASLRVAPSLDTYADGTGSPLHIGLPGAHQRVNASLAIALARAWEEQRAAASPSTPVSARIEQLARCQLPSEYLRGLATVHWPGRGQASHASSQPEWLERGEELGFSRLPDEQIPTQHQSPGVDLGRIYVPKPHRVSAPWPRSRPAPLPGRRLFTTPRPRRLPQTPPASRFTWTERTQPRARPCVPTGLLTAQPLGRQMLPRPDTFLSSTARR